MQRYLTGKSIAQSRLSLLFNAVAKVPMQFFILFIGAMVFVFFVFEQPPLLFHPVEAKRVEQSRELPTGRSDVRQPAFAAAAAAAASWSDRGARAAQPPIAVSAQRRQKLDTAHNAASASAGPISTTRTTSFCPSSRTTFPPAWSA